MLLKIAWRNIWRNKKRSLIVLTSIVIGTIAAVVLDGLSIGMLNQMLFNQINTGISYIQIHKKGFNDNKTVQNYMPDYKHVEDVLKKNPQIKYYSKRVITFGLLSSATNSSGVYMNGILPQEEENVSVIKSSIVEGSYLTQKQREILIGKDLAEKLGVGLGDKVVALCTTPDGTVGTDLFRISGIYETASSEFDKVNIYINLHSAQQMMGIGDNIYEFAIVPGDYERVPAIKDKLVSQLGNRYEVLSYIDLLPTLILSLDLYKESMLIFDIIIALALIFGIANVMLMSVFERIREFGVLMSIGIKNAKLFIMIIVEAFIIGVLGTVIGIGLGSLIELFLSKVGINLSIFAESLKSFGVGAIIYPVLSLSNIATLLMMIPFISVLAAIYPSYKAIKLEPVSAIRYI
jgi:putative ABC transport system permease protein